MNEALQRRIRKRLQIEVDRSAGRWLVERLPGFGNPIFGWNSTPLSLHEEGLILTCLTGWQVRFADVSTVRLLHLQQLAAANHAPTSTVPITLLTRDGEHTVTLPLYDYTALASILGWLFPGD